MKYDNIVKAKFISRPNRFIADVDIDGVIETVHVKNTGRCKEILVPGVNVILSREDNPARKTKYDLVAAYKDDFGLINIDSQAPNAVAFEYFKNCGYDFIKPEYRYGDSRIDFYMERNGEKYLTEVKGCTLEIGGVGFFPDAPTVRGTKHIYELIKASKEGYHCSLAFVIQMEGVEIVKPNTSTDIKFAYAIEEAFKNGVNIEYLRCKVTENELVVANTQSFLLYKK